MIVKFLINKVYYWTQVDLVPLKDLEGVGEEFAGELRGEWDGEEEVVEEVIEEVAEVRAEEVKEEM